MQKYSLEFILNVRDTPADKISESLTGLGENLVISGAQKDASGRCDLKICIQTDDPALIFDICSQFGKLKSVKID